MPTQYQTSLICKLIELASTQPGIGGEQQVTSVPLIPDPYPIQNLKELVIPLLAAAGCLIFAATTITTAKFTASSIRNIPEAKILTASAIIFCSTLATATTWLAATLLSPTQNHTAPILTIWLISTLPQTIQVLRQQKTQP